LSAISAETLFLRKLYASSAPCEPHEKRLKFPFSLSPSFAEFFAIVQSDSMGGSDGLIEITVFLEMGTPATDGRPPGGKRPQLVRIERLSCASVLRANSTSDSPDFRAEKGLDFADLVSPEFEKPGVSK
jgi:hypothetical protein